VYEEIVDPSSGATVGTTALSRVVGVDITENSGMDAVSGTVKLHDATDTSETALSFASR